MKPFKGKFKNRIFFKTLQLALLVMVLSFGIRQVPELIKERKVDNILYSDVEYEELDIDSCDLSGKRKANSVVDIGFDSNFANREYYAYTNSTRQLVYVEAEEIILQNDELEDVTSGGRYCPDEAKVKGTEDINLDEGHIIADSLGGVSNSYNITPQDSYLNQEGQQYQMEELIRRDGGANNFKAYINYPNDFTMIPSSYKITFEINGEVYNYEYKNEGS
ncbi:DNA/RNA non-specific endonuclease [Mollicutes bacterium LVI A0078]|nr:DNA/RNA non-specific endonuclease [Mollicutes bacterium LVI A0075]WOO90529.1 DNA/RNA non-specific endonuclease [Mollicutes bacterium LVI A0078]